MFLVTHMKNVIIVYCKVSRLDMTTQYRSAGRFNELLIPSPTHSRVAVPIPELHHVHFHLIEIPTKWKTGLPISDADL